MDLRVGVVLWFAALCLQYQICSAESSSNCSANYGGGGGDGREDKMGGASPWCGGEEKSADSGGYQRPVRTLADNRLPGVEGMRSMQRLPWIGGDIQKFAADLHDAKVRADAERQPSEEFHKVAESLMELLVRISENPDHWRVMTKNIMQARQPGVLPPEDKKSSADNRSDSPPPRPGVARQPDGRRRRLGFGLNKKKKPRQKGQGQKNKDKDQSQDKDADANRTDGRPLSEQEARRQRLRQLAEAGVMVPTVPTPARAGGGRGGGRGGGGRGGGGGKGRRPKQQQLQPAATTALPPRENQLIKQDWRNFQQQKMMWKHVRPSPEPEALGQNKVLTPIYGRYPSTNMNTGGGSGSNGGGQKFGTLTRHAPDGPTAMTPLDKVRKMPDGPRAAGAEDGGGAGGGGGGWDNATLSALRHGASLSRDEMVQRLLQNRPLPAELDLLSRQLGRVNKSAPEDEFGRWKQQMERLRSGPRVAVAPTPPPPPPQPPQRFRPYALLAGEPPPVAAPGTWATDRAGARLPVFDYHRQPPAGKGPFASVTVPSSTDQLRGEEFPTGRLVRMRDPLEQQLVDMATSAERQSLLRRRPLPVWGRPAGVGVGGGVGALQADPGPMQDRLMTLSDIEQQLRYHTQQTNRLRKILNAAAPRRA